ncbi:autophagy-related protein 22-like protein [Obelidium mucronatum]|nr:autophagy-related protein 22-like protein [Obelidium mucronatum]
MHKHLRERPGPAIPANENIATFSVKKVYTALRQYRKLKNLFIFLAGWFLFADALGTLSAVTVLFAQTEPGFQTQDILFLAIEVLASSIVGSLLWNWGKERTRLSTKSILLIQGAIFIVGIAVGFLGFFGLPVGYTSKTAIYVHTLIYGLTFTATQSTCRCLFIQLLPPGAEAEFFSLYELTDRSSAWLGPVIVAAMGNSGASKYYQFLFLCLHCLAGVIVFSFVNVREGISEGRAYGKTQQRDHPP